MAECLLSQFHLPRIRLRWFNRSAPDRLDAEVARGRALARGVAELSGDEDERGLPLFFE